MRSALIVILFFGILSLAFAGATVGSGGVSFSTSTAYTFTGAQTFNAQVTVNAAAVINGAITSSVSIGYANGAGAGGSVTQITSRTTGVELNKATGAIALFAASGSATPATFTVTDSAVAATDTIIINQKSGTNSYEAFVTSVGSGEFNVTFFTTGGTASDSPVFNFSVLKGSSN